MRNLRNFFRKTILFLLFLIPYPLLSFHSIDCSLPVKRPFSYENARFFIYSCLYPNGGRGLYTGRFFSLPEDRSRIQMEHVYPASWIGSFLGCGTRKQCLMVSKKFNEIHADPYNLYPVFAYANLLRLNYSFDLSLGMFIFDVGLTGDGLFRPPFFHWGEISRVLLYMSKRYRLPLSADLMKKVLLWNKLQPPRDSEYERSEKLAKWVGHSNLFVTLWPRIDFSPQDFEYVER